MALAVVEARHPPVGRRSTARSSCGFVGPNTPTTGVPTAAASCIGPVSPATKIAAARASSTRSATEVGRSDLRGALEAAATAPRERLLSGPHVTMDGTPCRARRWAAIAPKRSAGHCLFGQPAPGLITANRPPAPIFSS